MNKGIKENKSDTKRIKNVSKIATRVISDKKRSPTRGKNRSSSMNELVLCERVESPKKIVQKQSKPKIVNENSVKNVYDFSKSVDSSTSPLKNDRKARSLETSIKTREDIDDPINRKSKLNQKKFFFDELISREGSIEKLLQINKNAKTVFNVDGMSSTQIRKSLSRVDDKTAKPFGFLKDIIDHTADDQNLKLTRDSKDQELNPSDIDVQLSSLVKRVELNRTLLERANQRIKDINFLAERNRMISMRDMNYDEESFLKIKEAGETSEEPITAEDLTAVSHPANVLENVEHVLEELQKTMKSTIEMLGYVHQMSSGDLASGDIPSQLTDYLREDL